MCITPFPVSENCPMIVEFNILDSNGCERYLELTSGVVIDKSGNLKTIAQIIDISDKKRANIALIESEEKYRNLVDNSPSGIVVSDLTGHFLTVNKTYLEMSGFSDFDDLQKNATTVFDLIADEHKKLAWNNANKTLSGDISGSLYYTLLKKDGAKYPAEINSVILKNYNAEPTTFLLICVTHSPAQ